MQRAVLISLLTMLFVPAVAMVRAKALPKQVSKAMLAPTSRNAVQINLGEWDIGSDVEPTLFRRLAKASNSSSANEFVIWYEDAILPHIQYRYLYNRAKRTLTYGRRYSTGYGELSGIYVLSKVTDSKIQSIVKRETGHADDLLLFGCAKTRIK